MCETITSWLKSMYTTIGLLDLSDTSDQKQVAKLSDVSLHTFRHGFASIAAEMGYSELTIAGLPDHRSNWVTGCYIHLVEPSSVAAADGVSAELPPPWLRKSGVALTWSK